MAVTTDGTPYVEPGDAISAYPVVSQELAAVIDSLRTMIPVGSIFPYAGKTAPEGWLMCDGKAYTRADFYDLYVIMAEWAGQWGGFPNGNSQQFYVPDFRGRSPLGPGKSHTDATGDFALGSRPGDFVVGSHSHRVHIAAAGDAYMTGWPGGGGTLTSLIRNQSDVTSHMVGAEDHRLVAGTQPNWYTPDPYNRAGLGDNYHPATVVNFIVWSGTTTTGKSPVSGTELAPVTTRMMIEARLEQAGISDEEIQMLRDQLGALKEADNGEG